MCVVNAVYATLQEGHGFMSKLNIVVSLITDDNDYQLEQAASAQLAASKVGANVQIIYADNDAVQQTQQILGFVQNSAKRPDAILVEPVGTGMPQVAKAAVAAGIAWSVVNTEVNYIDELRRHAMVPVFSVLSDHRAIGKIQGEQISAFLGDKGCVLYLEGPLREVARLRTQGMMSTKPAGIAVKTLRGELDPEQPGYHAISSWLSLSTSKQLNVGMVACQNDDMAVGARRAFDEVTDMQQRDAWLRLPIHRMRRRSQIWAELGKAKSAGGNGGRAAGGRRCAGIAGCGHENRIATAGAHSGISAVVPGIERIEATRTGCGLSLRAPWLSLRAAALRMENPRLRRRLIAIGIASRQQHAAIPQLCF